MLTLTEILWEKLNKNPENVLNIAVPNTVAQLLDGFKVRSRKLDWIIMTGCFFIGHLRTMLYSDIINSSAV